LYGWEIGTKPAAPSVEKPDPFTGHRRHPSKFDVLSRSSEQILDVILVLGWYMFQQLPCGGLKVVE
jgi:hypothetical protein